LQADAKIGPAKNKRLETIPGRTPVKAYSRLMMTTAVIALLAVPAQAQDMKAEVIHWWTSAGESAALKVFADQFAKAGGTWVDSAIAGGANARTAAINRTVGGNPPTAMQFNTGKQFDELVEGGMLRDVEAIAVAGKWRDVMPKPIIDAVTRNGKIHAIPVNIHGQNWLWFNKSVLDKVGAVEPKNWDEAIATMEKIKAAGLIPLAFSGAKNWEALLFQSVMVDKGGPDLWQAIYGKRDPASAGSADFKATADTFAKLRQYVDPGSPGRNWNDATALVITGKAGMQHMGDWAKGEFAAAKLTAGKEYGCAVLSSKGGGYVIGGDIFALPKLKDAAATKAQDQLATVMLSPDAQIQFAQKKGSIPVRLDVDSSTLDICAQKAMKLLGDKSQQLPAAALLAAPAYTGALEDVISQFWNTPATTTDQFVAKMQDAMKRQ
jgi:glucose/mannose transport system substrate-binding protein